MSADSVTKIANYPRERRRAPRVKMEAAIGLHTETNFYTGFSEDISMGGLFIASYQLHEIGTQVDLKFALPTGYEIEVKGIVRWLRDPTDLYNAHETPGMGIEFDGLAENDRAAIEDFVSHRSPLFFD